MTGPLNGQRKEEEMQVRGRGDECPAMIRFGSRHFRGELAADVADLWRVRIGRLATR
jgi:hypothetical protein